MKIWPDSPGDSLTVIEIPKKLKADQIAEALKEDFAIIVSKGQSELKGKIIRIGHYGEIKQEDYAGLISAMESVLIKLGWNIDVQTGVKSFYETFLS